MQSMCYDMVSVLALAHAEGGAGSRERRDRRRDPRDRRTAGQKVSSFAEGKAALKAGQKINYEGASGPLDFDENGDAISVFGVNVIHGGKPERQYLLK